jgi:hypothetical protein
MGAAFATALAALALLLLHPCASLGQNSNAPVLSITYQGQPHISVYGLHGTNYQVQYTPSLDPTNWQVLTNFILGTSPYTVVDGAAPAGMRLYRGLLVATNAVADYAPTALTPAEIFRFSWQSGAMTLTDTLVVNSPTSGVSILQGSGPADNLSLVTVTYTRLGPFLAQIAEIIPPGGAFPMGYTNLYTLAFTSPGAGYFEVSSSTTPGMGEVGEFVRDRSFVGQQLAGAQLDAGEVYSLLTTNAAIPTLTTLVINSPTSGVLLLPGLPPAGGANPVNIEYSRLGPLSCRLQVVIPASVPFPMPQTNLYYLVYTSTNSGPCQAGSGMLIPSLGQFERDRSLIGQQRALLQLAAGEVYSLMVTNGGMTNLSTLVINSPTNGVFMVPGVVPPGGLYLVDIQYALLGPLSCQLQVVIPASGPSMPQTNLYYLVYTSPDAGPFQSVSGAAMISSGLFERDRSLVGQQRARPQLDAGEVYSLMATNGGISNLTTLVINSSTSGVLMSSGYMPAGGGFNVVSIQYTLLGPLSCQMEVVIPASGPSMPQTNLYYLVYTSPDAGPFQSVSGTAMVSLGLFQRDRSLVGQQRADAQLTAGEVFSLLTTNAGISTLATLVVNTPTSGMLMLPGIPPSGGLYVVDVQYSRLGPLSCQVQVVIPASGATPAQTNVCLLIYTSANSGPFQLVSGMGMYNLGEFERDQSLVGQQRALPQLDAGEVYSLLATNGAISNLTTLVINSPTSGVLMSSGNPPPGSFSVVSIQYARLGPLSCQMEVVIPPGGAIMLPQTNVYYLVYSAADGGPFQSSSSGPAMSSLGQFARDRSRVGQQLAPLQLTAGESYYLSSSNAAILTLEVLIINTPTDGILVHQGNDPEDGIYPDVALQYLPLGALAGQVQVVIPPTPPILPSRTNTYLMVYSAQDTGQFQETYGAGMTRIGQFFRNPPQ